MAEAGRKRARTAGGEVPEEGLLLVTHRRLLLQGPVREERRSNVRVVPACDLRIEEGPRDGPSGCMPLLLRART